MIQNKNITSKQYQILILLYRYRFLNRHQIQYMMGHAQKNRINSWLKDLTDTHIIGRKFSRKLHTNNQAAIYHLATKSRSILNDDDSTDARILRRVYREKVRSQRLINHCLLTADLFLLLSRELKSSQELHFFTKVDLVKHYYFPFKRPDAYVAIKSNSDTKRYFLEIIDPGTPRFMIRKQLSNYFDYFDEGSWQATTNYPNPTLLFICPDETLQGFLQRYIQQLLEEELVEVDMYTTTSDLIQTYQSEVNVWWQVRAG